PPAGDHGLARDRVLSEGRLSPGVAGGNAPERGGRVGRAIGLRGPRVTVILHFLRLRRLSSTRNVFRGGVDSAIKGIRVDRHSGPKRRGKEAEVASCGQWRRVLPCADR